jgi:hypothetical protein
MIPSDQKIKETKYVVKRGLGNSEFMYILLHQH